MRNILLITLTGLFVFSCAHKGTDSSQASVKLNRTIAALAPKYQKIKLFNEFFEHFNSQFATEAKINSVYISNDVIQVYFGSNSILQYKYDIKPMPKGFAGASSFVFEQVGSESTAGHKADWPTLNSSEVMSLITEQVQHSTAGFVVKVNKKGDKQIRLLELSETQIKPTQGAYIYFGHQAIYFRYFGKMIKVAKKVESAGEEVIVDQAQEHFRKTYCYELGVAAQSMAQEFAKEDNTTVTPKMLSEVKKALGQQRKPFSDFMTLQSKAQLDKYSKGQEAAVLGQAMMCSLYTMMSSELDGQKCYDAKNKTLVVSDFIRSLCQ